MRNNTSHLKLNVTDKKTRKIRKTSQLTLCKGFTGAKGSYVATKDYYIRFTGRENPISCAVGFR